MQISRPVECTSQLVLCVERPQRQPAKGTAWPFQGAYWKWAGCRATEKSLIQSHRVKDVRHHETTVHNSKSLTFGLTANTVHPHILLQQTGPPFYCVLNSRSLPVVQAGVYSAVREAMGSDCELGTPSSARAPVVVVWGTEHRTGHRRHRRAHLAGGCHTPNAPGWTFGTARPASAPGHVWQSTPGGR